MPSFFLHVLHGKHILLGVTGSIAAYKSAMLVRELVRLGAEVRVILTESAKEFVGALTFSTLSKHSAITDFVSDREAGQWNNHVEIALWADLFLIAPASANTLSKMASGQSDNMLLATYMSARCPVMIAPAMDHDMYLHPGTRENLVKLKSFGHIILEPEEGELASGLSGKGRMSEPEEIAKAVDDFFNPSLPLRGKKAVVTAGPTYEAIDPVRYIGNHSTGKMGFALAEELAVSGAEVTLIAGPVSLTATHPSIRRINVVSATDMLKAALPESPQADVIIFAAAVADYRPAAPASSKLKKAENEMGITLVPTPDIAGTLGEEKRPGQIFVGFALETNDEESNARGKLERKNLDLIVLNSLRDEGAGFGGDSNQVTLIWRDNKMVRFGLKPKSLVARDIVNEIVKLLNP